MSAVHINDLPSTTELDDNDYFVVETANETKKVKYADMGNASALKSREIGDTITQTIPLGNIVYYHDRFYKIKRDLSGETFPYTIVPATDLESLVLKGDEIISMDDRQGLGLNASDVSFDNSNAGINSINVQNAIIDTNKIITDIILHGSANTTGSTITSGTYFYLNGALCKAILDILNNATFTLNTNFEVVTVADELRELNSNLSANDLHTYTDLTTYTDGNNPYVFDYDGIVTIQTTVSASSNIFIKGPNDTYDGIFVLYSPYSDGGTRSSQVMVKKGMRCYVASNSGVVYNTNTWMRYMPIY